MHRERQMKITEELLIRLLRIKKALLKFIAKLTTKKIITRRARRSGNMLLFPPTEYHPNIFVKEREIIKMKIN